MTKKIPGETGERSNRGDTGVDVVEPAGADSTTKLEKMAHDRAPASKSGRLALGRRPLEDSRRDTSLLVPNAADSEPRSGADLVRDGVGGAVVAPVLAAGTGAEVAGALNVIRHPEKFTLHISTFLESINANATLPLGGPLFLATFTAWFGIVEQVSGDLTDSDKEVMRAITEKKFFSEAVVHVDELIDRQALGVSQSAEPKTCPVWFLYDVLKRIATMAGKQGLVTKLEEKWEVIQYIHAKQIARVDAPFVAEAIKQNFKAREVSILDVGARTGDALAELVRILSSQYPELFKGLIPTAIDLNPRKPMLAEKFAEVRLLSTLPPVDQVSVREGDVMNVAGSVGEKQDIVLAWNILHKLREDQHAEAVRQIAAIQDIGGVMILHIPYYDDRGGRTTGAIRTLLESIDTGNGAIRATSYWTELLTANGYRVFNASSVGTKTGNLDGFQHQVITAIREDRDVTE